MMKLYPVETGNFKLDGGAMFGVVPKVLWNKAYPADENNLCTWSMRSLLVNTGERLVLIDNGIGDTLDEKFLKHFYLDGDDTLEKSLKTHGFTPDDITDVILSHLHFDHCGGNVKRSGDGYIPAFPNARYWVSKKQYENALDPNAREKASYFTHMVLPLEEKGQLHLVENEGEIIPGICIAFYHGHTEGQIIPHIDFNGKTVVFGADLLPSTAHIPMPWVMAYDMQPLVTLDEKKKFFNEAVEGNYIIFLQHDHYHQCCTLKETDKGVRVSETFRIEDI